MSALSMSDAAALLPKLMVRQRRLRGHYPPGVVPDGACWIWQGSCANGVPRWTITRGKTLRVRRIVFTATRGPYPARDVAYALCGRAGCVAPDHLTVRPRAHWQHSKKTKLSDQEVAEIRQRYQAGELQSDLGAAYGVAGPYISQLCSGKSRCEIGGLE